MQVLNTYLHRGKTVVVVGSSGVGKSTMIKVLIGAEMLKTQSIREEDSRGRHTPTSRYFFQTHLGGLIIDTPGLREIQMLDQEQGLQKQFAEIEMLVMNCRFSDCQHLTEPGCEILASLQSGAVTHKHWQSYFKLLKEVRHMLRKSDKAMLREDRKFCKKRVARRVVSNRSGE